MFQEVKCTYFRGGTSKGLFFVKSDMPEDPEAWPEMLLSLMGSPDHLQIDGLGGAVATASKVAIVSPSDSPDIDVDYLFAQVSIDKPIVSYRGNCGNMASAVGPFAIEAGLIRTTDPVTRVRIHNVNTGKVIVAQVPTENGRVLYEGDLEIAGVPGTGAGIKMLFQNPAGSVTGSLLPTGHVVDTLEIPDFGPLEVSFVDSSNPLVFVRASDIGMTGKEMPGEIDGHAVRMDLIKKIRGIAAVKLGFITDYRDSRTKSPTVPKLVMVSAPQSYLSATGNMIESDQMDILCRQMSMQKTHKNYALTGALCTASAAIVPGTLVNQLIRKGFDAEKLRIGHPGGIMLAGVVYEKSDDGSIHINSAVGYRTARMLMRGNAFYRTK